MACKNIATALLIYSGFVVITMPASAGEIFLGISAQQSTLYISDKDTLTEFAIMESSLHFLPTLIARSKNNYFTDNTYWGFFLEFNIGYYDLDRQITNKNIVNLNTNISGFFWDLTPTLFYNFGSKEKEKWAFKTGIGIGIGYLSVEGTVVLTEKTGQPLVTYDDDGYGYTVGAFIEITKNDWVYQVKMFGPSLIVGDTDFQLGNINITLMRAFNF